MADQDSSQEQPSFLHGLMAGLTSGTNPVVNLGYGLMQAGGPPAPFQNLGSSLLGANAQTIQNRGAQQQQDLQNYSLQRMKAMMPVYQKALESAQNSLGGSGAVPSGNMTQGTSMAPPVPSAPANKYQPLDPLPVMGAGAIGQVNAGTALQAVPGMEKFGEALSGAPAKQQAILEGIVKQRQQAVAEPLSSLDTIMTSADADKRLQKDPDLARLWQQEQGDQPLTAPSARAYAGTVYNRLAGSVQSPIKPIPTMLQTTQRGLGESIQTDAVTGKISAGAPGLPTNKFVQNGQVVELPTAQGVSQKLQPYDSALYGAGQINDQALEQAYQMAKSKGDLSESLAGRDPIAAAKVSSYIAQRAGQEGVTGLAMAAKQQTYKAQQGVLDDFVDPSGKAGGALTAINTAVAHLTSLNPLIDAMGSGNLTRINQARQMFQRETGIAAPTNYQTLANMATGEVGKAVLAGGGDSGERDNIAAPFKSANSPSILKGAVQTAATALAGKTDALRNAWQEGTNGTQGSFDKFLMPATKQALGIPAQSLPSKNAQGWVLHKDAKGNQAYVSPDGKQFKQVQ